MYYYAYLICKASSSVYKLFINIQRDCPQPRQGGHGWDVRRRTLECRSTTATNRSSMLVINGYVGNRRTRMLIDTGSDVSILREDIWKAMCNDIISDVSEDVENSTWSSEQEPEAKGVTMISSTWIQSWTPKEIQSLQANDAALKQIAQWLSTKLLPAKFPKGVHSHLQTLLTQRQYLVQKNGIVYRQWEDVPGKGLNK